MPETAIDIDRPTPYVSGVGTGEWLEKERQRIALVAADDVKRAAGGVVDMNPYSTHGARHRWQTGYDLKPLCLYDQEGSYNWRAWERGRQVRLLIDSKTYEITAAGFDGSTDATDDRVFWVKSPNLELIQQAVEGTGAGFHDTIDGEDNIDYRLPVELQALRSKLLEFKEKENGKADTP